MTTVITYARNTRGRDLIVGDIHGCFTGSPDFRVETSMIVYSLKTDFRVELRNEHAT